jgi:hydroxyethylthiazole kinase
VTKCINTACDGFENARWPCFEHAWYALNDEAVAPANFKPILT